jgi:hypothetical protein
LFWVAVRVSEVAHVQKTLECRKPDGKALVLVVLQGKGKAETAKGKITAKPKTKSGLVENGKRPPASAPTDATGASSGLGWDELQQKVAVLEKENGQIEQRRNYLQVERV